MHIYTYIPAWQQLAASVVAATASASSIADAAASSFAEGKKRNNIEYTVAKVKYISFKFHVGLFCHNSRTLLVLLQHSFASVILQLSHRLRAN